MLEDDFTWVIRKAFKGLALAPGEAALRAGLKEQQVLAFSRGDFSPEVASQLAPALGLSPEALASHASYEPAPLQIPEIRQLDLPFGNERVNAWLIVAGGISILFDTGNDEVSCRSALREAGIAMPDYIFITHGHGDHIRGLGAFDTCASIYGAEIDGASSMAAGDRIQCGPLEIRACDLSGHFMPSLGFHISGLSQPVLVTGDALFAGSMGGCATPELYQHALARLKDVLTPLPDETALLPGHGPASTLGEERRANPFLV